MTETTDVVRGENSAVDVVLRLGTEAIVDVDAEGDDTPPILWIRTGLIDFMLMPFGQSEGGKLTRCDLSRSSDLVMAAVHYRDAIFRQLVEAGVIQQQPSRRQRRLQAMAVVDPEEPPRSEVEAVSPNGAVHG